MIELRVIELENQVKNLTIKNQQTENLMYQLKYTGINWKASGSNQSKIDTTISDNSKDSVEALQR